MAREEFALIGSSNAHIVVSPSIPTNIVVTVLLCDNSLLRVGLKHLLSGTCFAVSDTASHHISVSPDHSGSAPVLYLVDASGDPGRSVEAVRSIKSQDPAARVAVIADHYFDLGFVQLAFSAGVDGFCLAASGRDVLIKSLELIMLGERILPGALLRSMLQQTSKPFEMVQGGIVANQNAPDLKAHKLSPRETVILQSLMGGDPNKVIARKLDITEATIKVHVKAILRKIGAANRTQAAMWATGNLPPARTGLSAKV
jgi:DNA-binding NarL/FixJ family response regulator